MNQAMSKIINLMKDKKFQQAEFYINKELEKDSQSFDLNKLHAMNYVIQQKYNSAMIYLLKCKEINRNDYDININLSRVYNKVQDYKSSLKYSEIAMNINPERSEVYHNIAHSYLYIPDLKKAEFNVLKSIELNGGLESKKIYNYVDTLNLYTDILFAKGDEKSYRNICEDLLNNSPIHLGDIFRKLLRIDKNLITQNHLKAMETYFENFKKNPNLIERNLGKSSVYSCFAEYYQKIDKQMSESYYLKSKNLISDLQRESLYQRQEFIKKIINYSEEIDKVSGKFPDNLGKGLIFIIGMPRSGTTLTESIIATSENCIAGGEKVFFGVNCRPIIRQQEDRNIDYEALSKLGNRYLDIINIQRQGKKFYIDKMPENFLWYKFISASLPFAKFINIHRDPWDNAISLFKQHYVSEIFFSSSFFGIALEYANYEHVMRKWKKHKNNNILDIGYHELVNDTESTAKKIWEFCNLPGKYEEIKRTKYFAQTASKEQVRQNIYTSSIKKEEFLDFKEDFYKNLEDQRNYWLNT